MPALTELSVSELFAIVQASGDTSGQIGTWTADAYTTRTQNIPALMKDTTVAYSEAVTLITNAGMDANNLTNTQYVQAMTAQAFAVAYRLMLITATGASTLPAENFTTTRAEFGERIKALWDMAGKNYKDLGISDAANPYYDNNKVRQHFEIVTKHDATANYPFDGEFRNPFSLR